MFSSAFSSDRGEVVAAMADAMRLLIILCALATTPIAASHPGGVSSARTLDREPLASCHDPRIGEIFLTKWLHKSDVSKNFTRCASAASMTTTKHRRTFMAPEGPLPTGNEGSHTRHAAERELSGFDPWWWRSSVRLVRGGSMPKKMTDQDLFAREQQTVRNVLLYYPNLIGYARVALVLTSYYLAETNWKASSCLYVVAFAGDAVDGHVARKFNQASRFGAVLDMVTDRCSTAGLLLVLSRLYNRNHAFAFLVLMFLDLSSHWMHTHSVVDKHHKATTTLRRRNALIRTYYDNLPFFAFCCIGTELFYVLLYLLHFLSPDSRAFDPLRKVCCWLCLPACVLKQLINVAQICSAARTLALAEVDLQR